MEKGFLEVLLGGTLKIQFQYSQIGFHFPRKYLDDHLQVACRGRWCFTKLNKMLWL